MALVIYPQALVVCAEEFQFPVASGTDIPVIGDVFLLEAEVAALEVLEYASPGDVPGITFGAAIASL
jgi:hypothetical protein